MRSPRALLPLLLAACPGDSGTTDATASSSSSSAANTTSDSSPTSSATATDTGTVPTTDATTSPTTDATTSDTTAPITSGDPTTDASTSGSTGPVSTSDATTDSASTGAPLCDPGDTKPCYSGPPDTLGMGLCVAGEQTCDQGTFGPCEGEVLPAAETCDDPGDEDCDGFDPCTGNGGFQWHRSFGAAGDEAGLRLAFDAAGNLVVAARGTSTIDFGGGPLQSAGGTDLFLARLAPDGEHLWSKRFGDAANQFDDGYALAVAADGQIAVAGDFEGTIDFGGGPLVAKNIGDPFLARFDPDGKHVWSKAFKTGSYAYPQGLTFDPDGNLLVAGYFFVSLDLGGGVMNSAGMVDAFVAKLDKNGAHVWSQRFGDAAGQYILGLVSDAAGNVHVGGGFSGAIDLGKGAMLSAGDNDVFLGKLDPLGNAVWSKRFGDAKLQVLRDLAIDSQGRLALGGDTQGVIDFGGGPIGDASSHAFVAQVDGTGKHLWSHLVSTGKANLRGIAVDGPGAILLTGDFSGAGDFGGGQLVSAGSTDIYVLKLGPTGQHVWSQRFGDFQGQIGYDVAGSLAASVAVTGSFTGGVNFGGGPVNSKGGNDGFIAVFGP